MPNGTITDDATVAYDEDLLIPAVDPSRPAGVRNVKIRAGDLGGGGGGGGGGAVTSVAGRTGDVVLDAADVSGLAASATKDTTNASNITSGTLPAARLPAATTKAAGAVVVGSNITVSSGTISLNSSNVTSALGLTPVDAAGAAAAAPVQSVAGRTGNVTLKAADVSGLAAVATSGAYADLTGAPASYSLPQATNSVLGGVVVGSNITVSSGTISLTGGNVTTALGLTPVDAAGAAAAAPVQSVAGRTGVVTLSAADVSGLSKVATSGAYADLTGAPSPYSLPAATGSTLGGVIVGSNITVSSGTISLTGGNVTAALGLTPVDSKGAAAAAPVQSVAGKTGTVTLPYGMSVDFSQGAVPSTGTITLDGSLSSGVTITDAVHTVGTAGGSVTWRLQIVNGGSPTNVGGLNGIVTNSSSPTTTAATSANTGVAGNQLQLVITAVSGSPAGANITIRGTRP